MVKITQNLVDASKYSLKCPYSMTPEAITVHNTANDAPATNEISYMISNGNQTSFHYAVDDIQAIQGIPENRNAWHAGDGNGFGNRKTIGIEICYSKSGGDRFIRAEQNAVELIVDILKRYNWGIDKVGTHQMRSGKYCLPINETDLLTKNGWIKLADANIGDEIAQYNNGVIEFVGIEDIVSPYQSETIKNRVLEATPDHRILYKLQKSPNFNKWTDWETAQSNKSATYIPIGGVYQSEGIGLSDDELKLLVWVQGDGHYMYRKNLGRYGVEFHLSKQRKIDSVKSLLDNLSIKYTHTIQSNGTSKIRFWGKHYVEYFEEWLDDKKFSWKLLEMSEEQSNIFFEELLEVDGCKAANSYCTTKQQNYDVVQALASLSNRRSLQTTTGNSTGLIFTNSRLSVNTNNIEDLSYQTKMVGCVTVSSGAILIRQNGRTLVVGNCPHRTLDMGWGRFIDMIKNKMEVKVPEAIKFDKPRRYICNLDKVQMWDLTTHPNYKSAKEFKRGDKIEAYGYIPFNNNIYLVTEYSFNKGIKNGFNQVDMKEDTSEADAIAAAKILAEKKAQEAEAKKIADAKEKARLEAVAEAERLKVAKAEQERIAKEKADAEAQKALDAKIAEAEAKRQADLAEALESIRKQEELDKELVAQKAMEEALLEKRRLEDIESDHTFILWLKSIFEAISKFLTGWRK